MTAGFGAAEVGGGEGADIAVEAVFSGEDVECLSELFGEMAAPAAAVGGGLVEFSATGLADEGFHFFGAIGMD